MAQVKVYECPSCKEQFTTHQIKSNKKRCVGCGTPLKHEVRRKNGSMIHMWVADGEIAPIPVAKRQDETFLLVSKSSDIPTVYKNTDESARIQYRVLYVGIYQLTNLFCPKCGNYLHSTNVISGSRQQSLCRSSVRPEESESGKWAKCKARTEFIFLSQGVRFNAETDV